MAIRKINSIFDIAAIKAESAELGAAVEESYGKIVNMYNLLNKIKGTTTMSQAIKDSEEITVVVQEAKKATDELSKAKNKLAQAQAEDAKAIAAVKLQTLELNKANKEAAKETLGMVDAYQKLEKEFKDAAKAAKDLQAKAKLDPSFAKQAEEAAKKATVLNNQLKEIDATVGNYQRNVGNYQGSAKIIVDALEKEKKKLEELEKTRIRVQNAGASPVGQQGIAANAPSITARAGAPNAIGFNASKEAQSLDVINTAIEETQKKVDALSKVTNNDRFLNIAGKVGDATAEVRFFTKALIDLEKNGLGNTDAAKQLRTELAQLTDQIGDTKAEIKALSSDTRGFDLFAGSVSFAADAFQTFAGAAVLAGASEEDAAEATKTLIAVQSVANGVKGIANELTTRGTAANKIYAFSQLQVKTAMDATATTGARLKAVLATLGFGAIIVGIGLLIANFSKIKDAVTGATIATKAYDETLSDYREGAKSAIESVNKVGSAFQLAKDGVISKDEALFEYNKTLGDSFGKTNDLAEAEGLFNEKAGVYIEIMGLKAQANALYAKSADEAAKGITAANEDQIGMFDKLKAGIKGTIFGVDKDLIDGLIEAQNQGVADIKATTAKNAEDLKSEADKLSKLAEEKARGAKITTNTDFSADQEKKAKAAADKAKKAAEDALKARLALEERNYQATKKRLTDEANESIRKNQQVLENDNSAFKEQLAAIEAIAQNKKNILAIETADQLRAARDVKDGKIVEAKKTEAEILSINQESGFKLAAINDETLKSQQDAQKANADKINAAYEKSLQDRLVLIDKQAEAERDAAAKRYSEDIKLLNDSYNAGLINKEEYDLKRLQLDVNYQVESLKREIAYQKELIAISDLSDEKKAEALRKIAELEKQLSDATLANTKKSNKEKLEHTLQTLDKIKEQYDAIFGGIGNIIAQQAENEIAAIDEKQRKADETYNQEVENINNSTLNEQQKEEALKILAKEKETRDKQAERRRIEAQAKQARFEKANAIAQIAFNTGASILKLFRDYPFFVALPLSAAIGAIGAAQIASVAARPIPQYAEGTEDHQGGLAVVGEGKHKELVQTPDGDSFIADRPMLLDLPKHTKVRPLNSDEINQVMHFSLLRSMAASMQMMSKSEKQDKSLENAIHQQTRILSSAFSKAKPVVKNNINIDMNWQAYLHNYIYH